MCRKSRRIRIKSKSENHHLVQATKTLGPRKRNRRKQMGKDPASLLKDTESDVHQVMTEDEMNTTRNETTQATTTLDHRETETAKEQGRLLVTTVGDVQGLQICLDNQEINLYQRG